MAKADKGLQRDLSITPLDEDVAASLTESEKDWLRSWNRHEEIPGEDESDEDETDAEDDTEDGDDYDSWTNAQLSAELKRRELPSSGNHDELVARLEEDDEE